MCAELLQLGVAGELLAKLDLCAGGGAPAAAELQAPAVGVLTGLLDILQDALRLALEPRPVALGALRRGTAHLARLVLQAALGDLCVTAEPLC